jgi:hypothetical protein
MIERKRTASRMEENPVLLKGTALAVPYSSPIL